jgi:hypothetical protein
MKEQYSESEGIVTLVSYETVKRPALKLWRSVFGKPDMTGKLLPISHDLKAVAINQSDCCLFRYKYASCVDVPNDMSAIVNQFKSARDVDGSMNQKVPSSVREIADSALRAIQQMNLLMLFDLFHYEASQSLRSFVIEYIQWPSCVVEKEIVGEGYHQRQLFLKFALPLLKNVGTINFGRQTGTCADFVNFTFAA